jgi:putative component of membrane protein insertase Oxa1/YidC/SpoIIIJ protein YidD
MTLITLITTGLKSMNSLSLDTLTRQTAIQSIQLYQRHLSPRKGYSCPHRVLYQENSCSDYVKSLLMKQDLTSTVQMSMQRFRSCALAAQKLKLQNQGGCIVIPCCIPL